MSLNRAELIQSERLDAAVEERNRLLVENQDAAAVIRGYQMREARLRVRLYQALERIGKHDTDQAKWIIGGILDEINMPVKQQQTGVTPDLVYGKGE